MHSIAAALLALTAALFAWFISRLYTMRRRMRGLPGPPHHFIWGHLQVGRDCVEKFPKDCHPHLYAEHIRQKYKLGNFFYVDFWPLGDQYLMITDPDVANQITVGSTMPKSPLESVFMESLVGAQNMVGLEGAAWKRVRAMFNPGFAHGHLMTLVPYMVDAATVFTDVLAEKARTGEVFELEEIATRLTVDVIAKVTLDVDLNTQRSDHRILTTFRKRVALLPMSPADRARGLSGALIRPFRLWYNGRQLDRYIGEELDQRYAQRAADETSRTDSQGKKKTRYAIDLALDTYEKDFQDSTTKPSSTKEGSLPLRRLDPTFRQSAIDQFKTFIFAGHDTTSSTIAWVFYLLHRHPTVQDKVVDEIDAVFGPVSSCSATDKLRSDPYLLNRLPYTTAVIKETLRIFPPASTIRYGTMPGHTITDPSSTSSSSSSSSPSATYPTSDFHVWPVSHAIHRHPAYFPDPTSFIPERHLDVASPPFPEAKRHRDALRPFEKGPRNCLGQELAMLEVRLAVVMAAREFDFEAFYPEVGKGGMEEVEGHRCYQVLKGSAKPKSGLPGVVRRR